MNVNGFNEQVFIAGCMGIVALLLILIMPAEPSSRLIFFMILICSSWFDIRYRIIPNEFILIGTVAAMFFIGSGEFLWKVSAGSAMAIFLILFLIRWSGEYFYRKPGFGMGDLKLFAVAGLFMGWQVFWLAYLTILLAGLFSAISIKLKTVNRDSLIPLAPFILAAGVLGDFLLPWEIVRGWLL